MDMTGTQRIEASREAVYAALNDVDILRQCIPGCESIEKLSDQAMKAKVTLKIGPMKVSFSGAVTLSELDPPNGYTITGEGSGGIAGFAKGTALVRLEAEEAATILHYTVKAEIGGKLAQLGARLIDGTAKKLAGEFFAKLGMLVNATDRSVPTDEPEASNKAGWLGRMLGSTAALAVSGLLLVPACCLAGHGHAVDDGFSICHAAARS